MPLSFTGVQGLLAAQLAPGIRRPAGPVNFSKTLSVVPLRCKSTRDVLVYFPKARGEK